MATINLGSIKFNWKGDYAAGTAYAVDDVVNSSGTSYVCVAASTGNAPPNATYWNVMAQGGTDIGTTLTTQGDILYRDGSGLQRLPKGTAGQVLQMNSGATAPEYGTVSSDYVKIASGSHSGAELNIDNVFTDTYPLYKVYLYDVNTPNSSLRMRARTGGASGTTSTGSEYRYNSYMKFKSTSANSSTDEHGWGNSNFRIGWTNNSVDKPQMFELTIPTPTSTSRKFIYGMLNTFSSDTYVGSAHGVGLLNESDTTVYTGLNFFQDGGNNWSGMYAVYGIKI